MDEKNGVKEEVRPPEGPQSGETPGKTLEVLKPAEVEAAEEEEEKRRGFAAFFAKFFNGLAFKIAVVTLLAGVITLLAVEHFSPKNNSMDDLEASVKAKLGQLENKTEEEIREELNRIIEEGMFHVAINARPIFEDGQAEGNLEIENVPNNLYAMRVEITLDDTGERVYNSGLVDPNYHIQEDKLSVDLDAGQYPATATFYAYDMETLEQIGTVSAKLTIYVKN